MVSWPNEGDIVSVISDLRQRVSGPLVVGEVCEVTERRKKHPARVHATGLLSVFYLAPPRFVSIRM